MLARHAGQSTPPAAAYFSALIASFLISTGWISSSNEDKMTRKTTTFQPAIFHITTNLGLA
jgi:hypothetical protein